MYYDRFHIICDVDNVDEIVSGILKLIDDQEFSKKIGDKAQSDFYENYTLKSFEKNMLSTFVKIKNKIWVLGILIKVFCYGVG